MFFDQCMHCRHAMRKMDMKTRKWYVSCGGTTFHMDSGMWNDGTRIEHPKYEIRNECPCFTERFVASLNEEKQNESWG